MDANSNNKKPAAKKGPSKLPSKNIFASSQGHAQSGKQKSAAVSKGKKGGVNLMRKLSGM